MIKRLLLSSLSILITLCAASGWSQEIIYQTSFEGKNPLQEWTKSPEASVAAGEGINGTAALKITVPGPETSRNLISIPLDLAKARACGLLIEADIRGENLSKPNIPYLGPKIMIHMKSPYNEFHTDNKKRLGTFGWEKTAVFVRIPDSAEKLELCIGIQDSSGTMWVDNIKVTAISTTAPFEPLKASSGIRKSTNFRGVMSGHALKDEDLKTLGETWNANLIRYQIANFSKKDLSSPEKYRKWVISELDKMDAILPLFEKYGIKVLIDMHSGPASNQEELLSNRLSWTFESQDALTDVWKMIAARYKGDSRIWGYDILNEPREDDYVYTPGGPTDWNGLAERVAKAIRDIDPAIPIIVEPANWGSVAGLEVFRPINVPGIIYSIHFYSPGEFTHQGVNGHKEGAVYPGKIDGTAWNKEKLRQSFTPVIEFQKKYNVPIYVGEFSAARYAPGAEKYIEDCISIFEENGWDWTYHAYREADVWDAECGPDKANKTRLDQAPVKDVLIKQMKLNRK